LNEKNNVFCILTVVYTSTSITISKNVVTETSRYKGDTGSYKQEATAIMKHLYRSTWFWKMWNNILKT
jgi:hypothetical protein